MYRGEELVQEVDQSFAFLDNVSNAGSISRGRNPAAHPSQSPHQSSNANFKIYTWGSRQQPAPSNSKTRSQLRYWEPKFQSVRSMPGYSPPVYAPPKTQNWEERRRFEEQIEQQRQQEWDRARLRREEERKAAERREEERLWKEEQLRQRRLEEERRLKEQSEREDRLRREEEDRMKNEKLQRAEIQSRQDMWRRDEDGRERKRVLENQQSDAGKSGDQVMEDEKIRRWKIHPPQRIDPSEWLEENDENPVEPERIRHWDVHPSGNEERLKQWKEELRRRQLPENSAIGTYVPPPKPPNDNKRLSSHANADKPTRHEKTESVLLKRTNLYLDAVDKLKENGDSENIQRKENVKVASFANIPQPPSMDGLSQSASKDYTDHRRSVAARIQDLNAGPAPPPPPPMPTFDPNQTIDVSNGTPTLREVQHARGALRPIDKRIIVDKTYESEPKTFKEKLNRLLEFQLAAQKLDITKPPVLESYMKNDPIKYKTVRTLSKAAMKDKLEVILVNPPQKPSFREADMDEKRKEVLAKLRSPEERVAPTRLRRKPSDKLPFPPEFRESRSGGVNGANDVFDRQKMLMGNVLATIKSRSGTPAADYD